MPLEAYVLSKAYGASCEGGLHRPKPFRTHNKPYVRFRVSGLVNPYKTMLNTKTCNLDPVRFGPTCLVKMLSFQGCSKNPGSGSEFNGLGCREVCLLLLLLLILLLLLLLLLLLEKTYFTSLLPRGEYRNIQHNGDDHHVQDDDKHHHHHHQMQTLAQRPEPWQDDDNDPRRPEAMNSCKCNPPALPLENVSFPHPEVP